MNSLAALGSSCFPHNPPTNNAKSKRFVIKTARCSLRKQSKMSLKTAWPSISIALVSSGFFLGPLIDGLHSRVGLVVYDYAGIDIGLLHAKHLGKFKSISVLFFFFGLQMLFLEKEYQVCRSLDLGLLLEMEMERERVREMNFHFFMSFYFFN